MFYGKSPTKGRVEVCSGLCWDANGSQLTDNSDARLTALTPAPSQPRYSFCCQQSHNTQLVNLNLTIFYLWNEKLDGSQWCQAEAELTWVDSLLLLISFFLSFSLSVLNFVGLQNRVAKKFAKNLHKIRDPSQGSWEVSKKVYHLMEGLLEMLISWVCKIGLQKNLQKICIRLGIQVGGHERFPKRYNTW